MFSRSVGKTVPEYLLKYITQGKKSSMMWKRISLARFSMHSASQDITNRYFQVFIENENVFTIGYYCALLYIYNLRYTTSGLQVGFVRCRFCEYY